MPVATVRITGMLVRFSTATTSGPACRDCGIARTRGALTHDLLFGWWGLRSFFANVVIVGQLLVLRLRLRRLAAPEGPPLAPPLAPARPVLATPGPYLVLVAVALLAVAVFPDSTGPGSKVGSCVVIDPVAASVRQVVPCDGDEDARVVGFTRDIDACPAGTDGALAESGHDERLACVDVDG